MNLIRVKHLGIVDYQSCFQAMQDFTRNRQANTHDEIWLCQHPAVYTQGLNGQPEHLLNMNNIPLVNTDRGGQVTYHGPGQLVIYLLLNLQRLNLRVKNYVNRLEQSLIDFMSQEYQLPVHLREGAPGVYVEGKKIVALGIRIKKGCSYHGLAINVDLDLSPYNGIHPCGYKDLIVTKLSELGVNDDCDQVTEKLLPYLLENLGLMLEHSSEQSAIFETRYSAC